MTPPAVDVFALMERALEAGRPLTLPPDQLRAALAEHARLVGKANEQVREAWRLSAAVASGGAR